MIRNRSKDMSYFNCSQQHEHDYVVSLYINKDEVRTFLRNGCKSGLIHFTTHNELYELIKKYLGYDIPV